MEGLCQLAQPILANSPNLGRIGIASQHGPSMPYLLRFHAIHFWNPRSILVNPMQVLWMVFEILLRSFSGNCDNLTKFFQTYCGRVTLFILIHPRNHMAPPKKRTMTIARVLDTSKARMHAQDRMLLDTRTDPTPNSLFTQHILQSTHNKVISCFNNLNEFSLENHRISED